MTKPAESNCGKKAYPTERAAITIALRASRRSGTPLRVYRCHCGAWHLTKKKEWLDAPPAASTDKRDVN